MRRAFRRAARVLAAASVLGLLAPALAQTVSRPTPPPAFGTAAPRPTSESAVEARIENAWMSHPATSAGTLKAVVSHGILEVHGDVPSDAARQAALAIARENCSLPVTDFLKIKPFTVRQPGQDSASIAKLTASTQDVLHKTLGPAAASLRVEVTETGQIALAGPVPTAEHKAEIARQLRSLPGCTSVQNYLTVGAAPTLPGSPATAATASRQKAPVMTGITTLPPSPATRLSYLARPPETPPIDLLTPPAQPTSTTGQQAEEMHLFQLPALPGAAPRPAPAPTVTASKTKVLAIAKTSQFASLSPHAETPIGQAIPVPTAPLGAPPATASATVVTPTTPTTPPPATRGMSGITTTSTPTGKASAGAVVVFDEPQEEEPAPAPVPRSRPLNQPVVSNMVPAVPASHTPVNAANLKKRVESICGKLALEVRVTQALNQELKCEIQVSNVAAEEQLIPRLLAMPEVTAGQVRLEVFSLQR
jgi:osmotically-inducible protein OsmY